MGIFIDDDSRHAAQNCRSKQGNIQRLQTELNSMEKQAASVQQQIDSCVTELNVFGFTLCIYLFNMRVIYEYTLRKKMKKIKLISTQ